MRLAALVCLIEGIGQPIGRRRKMGNGLHQANVFSVEVVSDRRVRDHPDGPSRGPLWIKRERYDQPFSALDTCGTEIRILAIGPGEDDRLPPVQAFATRTEITPGGTADVIREATCQRYPAELLTAIRRWFEEADAGRAAVPATAAKVYCRFQQSLEDGI